MPIHEEATQTLSPNLKFRLCLYFQMLLIIVLFCMAFASTFNLLLAERPRFRNFGLSVLSSFIAMLGDFAYDDLFVDIGLYPAFYTFKLFAFVVFVLLMGIVVNNVLIGLAVGDTDRVINKAKVQRLREQVSSNESSIGLMRVYVTLLLSPPSLALLLIELVTRK